MVKGKRSLWVVGAATLLLAAFSAHAQDSGSDAIIGPPQLKDFSLEPRETIVRQPPPTATPTRPVEIAPPAPATTRQNGERPASTTRAEPAGERAARPGPASTGPQAAPQPPAETTPPPAAQPAPVAVADPGPAVDAPVPVPADSRPLPPAPTRLEDGGTPIWYFGIPALLLGLFGAALLRRRRAAVGPAVEPEPLVAAPAPPPRPRPDPVPRPWLEIEVKAERAAYTATEAEIAFDLEISNKGGSPARNLRIDVKLFNAGAEQDKEIGAFFRTAGRESTKLNLPGVEAGVSGKIQGTVAMKREEIRAMRLDERLLFIPVLAVNILYDWGEGRTGQTSKSYLIGRELQDSSEKMGPFRVDQGPRVWRSVGQRPHKLARKV